MKHPFTRPPRGAAVHALHAFLFGLGTSYPLLAALSLPVSFGACAALCAGAAAAFLLLGCVKRMQMLFYPLLTLCMLLPFWPYRMQSGALSNALTLFLSGHPLALAAYAQAITALVALMMTGIGISLARSAQSFFLSFLLTIGVLFAVSFSGAQVAAPALLPLAAALMLSARPRSVPAGRIVPLAALVSLLTLLLLPLSGATVPALSDAARRAAQAIDDYLFFNDARTAFSLSATGWQPLGSDRLGGPVAPSDTPVMQVKTGGRTLLRGIVMSEYTGLAWQDGTTPRRYLLRSPRFYRMKEDLFDLSRPQEPLRSELLGFEMIDVTMQSDAVSTLFLTQRFLPPSGEGIVAYFSPATEVFATHSLQTGERYAFSGSRLTSETPGVRAAVLACAQEEDPYLSSIEQRYLQLPGCVSPQVYALAEEICARLDQPYDRAAAICMHLQNSYPYTLLQREPPAASDFVSWFLLEEQQGYCTSFASAMAVMCRAVGIPARYIEGYAAQPDADGVARVTHQQAHAWVEVYFPGFGWLTFDPTPGSGQSPDTSEYAAPDGGAQEKPDASGAPEDTPTPTPSPAPTPTPTASPTPTPEHSDPDVTPTPDITPTPTPTPTPGDMPSPAPSPTPPPDDPDAPDRPRSPLWLLLLALALLALCALRLYLSSPAIKAKRVRLAGDALLIWYAAIEDALRAQGLSPAADEAPASFLMRAQKALSGKPQLTRLSRSVCAARYSRHKLAAKEAAHARSVYCALLERMTFMQLLRLYAARLVRLRRPT